MSKLELFNKRVFQGGTDGAVGLNSLGKQGRDTEPSVWAKDCRAGHYAREMLEQMNATKSTWNKSISSEEDFWL